MKRTYIIGGITMLVCMASMIGNYMNESRTLRRRPVMNLYLTLAVVEAIFAIASFAGAWL